MRVPSSRLLAAAALGLGVALLAPAHACHAPASIGDDWQATPVASAGFDSAALCAALEAVASGPENIHGIVIERRGRLVAELYRDGPDKPIHTLYGLGNPFAGDAHFGPQVQHDMRSISKSVVALLVGVALDKGAPFAVSAPVASFYPEQAALQSPEHQRITLAHLLTMSSGLRWDEGGLPNDETRLFWTADLPGFVLARPFDTVPGQAFHYNSGGTAVLADILARSQQTSLRALAREQLFEPLGIRDWEWASDLRGRELAFTGLRMRPRDLAKLGRLVLAQGRWRGKQIVPAAWIKTSIAPHLSTPLRVPPGAAEPLGYGYQWWTGSSDWNGRRVAWSAAFGNGGQRLYVVPALDLTVVITAGDYGAQPINAVVQRLFERVVASVKEGDAPEAIKP